MLLPNSYELVTLLLLVVVWLVVPALVALGGYWVVRLAVRHELRRTARVPGAPPGPAPLP